MGRGGRRERLGLSILRRNASVIGQTACWRRTEAVGLSGKQGGTAETHFLSLFPTGEQGLFSFLGKGECAMYEFDRRWLGRERPAFRWYASILSISFFQKGE